MPANIYKIHLYLKRKPGMSVEDFRDYYENHHVPLCLKFAGNMTGYTRKYVQPLPNAETGEAGEFAFDVVTELSFPDEASMHGAAQFLSTGPTPDAIIADELQFLDRPMMRAAIIIEKTSEL